MEGNYDRVYACVPNSERDLAAAKAKSARAEVKDGNSEAVWEAKFGFENELFPSLILSMSGRGALKASSDPHSFGDEVGIARVVVRPSAPNSKVRVEIQIDGFADLSTIDVTLPDPGQQYRIAPVIRWNYSRLAETDQSIPATATYRVNIDGKDLPQQTQSIRVRSVNDVPFVIVTPDGKQRDLSFLFAGFVNESHPFVQQVLQKALNYRAVNAFDGYSRGPAEVRLQVFALWNVLQREHMHYSSITTPSAASPSSDIYIQYVRFIDQSIQSQQANCVDGSVLFASLLYKIGIDPILVVKPGHMFVGYFLDKGHKQLEFLETTRLGAGHQPSSMNIAFSPVLHPVQGSESWREFVNAVQFATNMFNQEVLPAIEQHKPQYRFIDVAKAREAGINAIPRPTR